MKKTGILNAQLIGHIAALGHKDTFMIGDAGMPVPKGVPIVDLILCGGVPTFKQVMDAVLAETAVEGYTIAEEIKEYNPELLGYTFNFLLSVSDRIFSNSSLLGYIREKLAGTEEEMISHVALKQMSAQVKFAVRTGEFTPYPNIILRAGVAFPV